MSDFTYAENVAHAHICAAEALDSRIVSVAGKVLLKSVVRYVKLSHILIYIESIYKGDVLNM